MPMSVRAARSLGLGFGTVLFLAAGATARQAGGAAPAATPAPAAAPASPGATAPAPAGAAIRIGSIDMDRVFKDYKKVKFTSDQLKGDALAKQGELQKVMAQMRQIAQELEGMAPGAPDYKSKEIEITKLKAQLEAEREQAQADFARREAEALATIYKEVQEMTAAVARQQAMTYVVKVSSEPVTGSDPNSVMAAMARSVVYFDPSMDVTNRVVYYLNQRYEAAGGAKATTATPAPVDPATRTTSGAAPAAAPARTATAPAPAARPTR
jgi:outer membrane protein